MSFNNKFNCRTINNALSYVLNKRFINEIIVGFNNFKQFRDILEFKNIHNIGYTFLTNIDKNTIIPISTNNNDNSDNNDINSINNNDNIIDNNNNNKNIIVLKLE